MQWIAYLDCFELWWTGLYGGVGAAQQVRDLMGELGSVTMPQLVCIPVVHAALNAEGVPQNETLLPQADKLVKQLTWYAKALKAQRDSLGIPQWRAAPVVKLILNSDIS